MNTYSSLKELNIAQLNYSCSPTGLSYLSSSLAILNPTQCCKVGRLGNIVACVEAGMISVRKCDDKITRLLANLHTIKNVAVYMLFTVLFTPQQPG